MRTSTRTILSAIGAIALGGVLSAVALFVAAAISMGYALNEPAVVNSILIAGPLLGLMTWAVAVAVLYAPPTNPTSAPATPPPSAASGPVAMEPVAVEPVAAAGAVPLAYERSARPTPASVLWRLALFTCGLALALPLHLAVLAAARPFRGTVHYTELGTALHDGDPLVMPLGGLALIGVGCAIAAVLVRRGAARWLGFGLLAGCVALGLLIGMRF
jgi:hypothetical protein